MTLLLSNYSLFQNKNKIIIPLLPSKSISFKCKSVMYTCSNPDSSSFLLPQSTNFVMTSCAGLHEKSVPSVAATFSISYPCSRAVWHTTFSQDSRVSVVASADLWSLSTMNRDWAEASNADLLEFPKKI